MQRYVRDRPKAYMLHLLGFQAIGAPNLTAHHSIRAALIPDLRSRNALL